MAIIGRPNVGKSTLFNRLIRKRKSITDPTPGVTRDPVFEYGTIASRRVLFVDTGGLTESRDFLDRLITQKSMNALAASDVLLFVLDVTEITPEDEEFMQRLRQFSDRLILVVNKVDNRERAADAYEYYSYGFETVLTLSAAHGLGIEELQDEILVRIENLAGKSADAQGSSARPWDISIAVLGQPNTGKSTLANFLTGTENSIVSPVAGTTRDVIEGLFQYRSKVYRILDTAGIRRKNKVSEDLEYYSVNRAIRSVEEADVVILLIDVEKGLVEQDKKIAAQIVKKGRGVILAANKWDTLEQTPNTLNAVTDRIRFLFPVLDFAPVVPLSAKEGFGIDKLLASANEINEQLNKRVDTGPLNASLERWIERTPPPQNAKHRWKIRYITQVSKHPVQFVLFVNKSKGFPDSYLGYIRNQIRKDYGFQLVPLQIELRDRR